MTSKDTSSTARLAEYNSLRSEILTFENRQGQHITLVWTGTVALISAASVAHSPLIAILAIFFCSALWMEYLNLSSAKYRVGEYIAVCIEPSEPGLQWETKIMQLHSKYVSNRHIMKRVAVALFSNFGIFGLIAIVTTLTLIIDNWPNEYVRQCVILALYALSLICFIGIVFRAANQPLHRGRNASRFKELSTSLSGDTISSIEDVQQDV